MPQDALAGNGYQSMQPPPQQGFAGGGNPSTQMGGGSMMPQMSNLAAPQTMEMQGMVG